MCGAVTGILDLPEGEEVVVAGTAYKEMKLKASLTAFVSMLLPSGFSTQRPARA